jgi:hypothetical protein
MTSLVPLAVILLLVGCAGKPQPGDAANPPAGSDEGATDGAAVAVDALSPLVDLAPTGAVEASAPLDAVAGQDVAADSPIADASAHADAPDGDAAPAPAADGAGEVSASPPLDLYIMFDQSGSMLKKDNGLTTRIDVVRTAVGEFLRAPQSAGIGIGIGFFGYHPLICACTSCVPADYATPTVSVGLLPQNADPVIAALAAVQPTGETPTGPALRGACQYAGLRRQSEPARRVAILLVTDGLPEAPLSSLKGGCSPTLADAVTAAQQCLTGDVRTYVLGVGPALEELGQIAAAGGTTRAYLASTGEQMMVSAMLEAIRADGTR